MVRYGQGLDHGGLHVGHVVGDVVEDVLGHRHVLREASVAPILVAADPQDLPVGAQVHHALAAHVAFVAVDGGIEGDPIPHLVGLYAFAAGGDDAGSLVAHDDGGLAAAGAAVEPVDVAPADGAGLQPDQDLPRLRFGALHLLIGQFLILVHDKGFHSYQYPPKLFFQKAEPHRVRLL